MTTKRQKPETYALTMVTHQRRSLFQRTENAQLMIDALLRYRDQNRFALHAFVVMPDHIHLIITPAEDHATSRCVQLIKGGFSFAVREQVKGEVWNPGHHEHRVRDAVDFRESEALHREQPGPQTSSRLRLRPYKIRKSHRRHPRAPMACNPGKRKHTPGAKARILPALNCRG